MAAPTDPARQRALRRRHKHERQAVIFGVLVTALVVAGAGSVAVYTGALEPPFDRPFSTPAPSATALAQPVACPAQDALPVPYAQVTVHVLNASGRSGQAGAIGSALTARGFTVVAVGNNPGGNIAGGARITYGTAGVEAAHTLAAHFADPELVLDSRTTTTLDLALGTEFAELLPPDTIALDPDTVLAAPTGCVPVSRITPAAGTGAPLPEQTEDEDEDAVEATDDEAGTEAA